ncbi:hypothetical protein [Mycobacterium pseudokansasii]|uniref:hypothetical protein n=1 Tax=Mycobacterium pseudokansasii TaxID=2341080 RepID=UPI0007B53353|nr:hypothetical protein [Mycobacterium pseudokansasii]KZS61225.1 hypothetical protein A4G27_24345 [Mycobacterium kansasii]VAZ93346.1 hypothetical protein LAUMK35_02276 [Mycobacterium pseudokansasii]VAZ94356.1 hypothetical protein LAUMK21_02276 [Mycobacterium pseudokansasii]
MTATEKQEPKTTKVAVLHPFKVTHAGVGYWPGERAEVPAHVAAEWVKLGFVELVTSRPEPEPADADVESIELVEPVVVEPPKSPRRARR